MGRHLITKTYITEAEKIYNNLYDYTRVNYINNKTNITIGCNEHGFFEKNPYRHLKGSGCPKCSNDKKKYNTENYIIESNIIHNNRYDYSNTIYTNASSNIDIICRIDGHGLFKQNAYIHKKGANCPKCSDRIKLDICDFIERSTIIHGDLYDYSESIYTNNKTKLVIKCKKHGIFKQRPNDHLSGYGCPSCGGTIKKDIYKFIQDANNIHNNKYKYDNVIYTSSNKKISIECSKHGIFKQTPNKHISGQGCPKCNKSRGETIIENFLTKSNIEYIPQKSFDDLIFKNKLIFDFYLPTYNMCIEYDGIQHFEPIKIFGGVEKFHLQKMKDDIKNNYCFDKKIKLVRISYKDFDIIYEILKTILI